MAYRHLVRHAIAVLGLSFALGAVAQSNVDACKTMTGSYSVPPIVHPPGLLEVSRLLLDERYELGKPAFKVVSNNGDAVHQGVYSGTERPIKLQTSQQDASGAVFRFFGDGFVTCSYALSKDDEVHVIQVDWHASTDAQATYFARYIAESWGSAILDIGRSEDFERLRQQKTRAKGLSMTGTELRKFNHFMSQSFAMTGGPSYIIFVPLQVTP